MFRGLNFYKGEENVTPRNLYRYKLWKIIMTGIFIGIYYENNNDNSIRRYENNNGNSISN